MCFIFALDTAATQCRGTTDADEQTSREADESSQGCLHMARRVARLRDNKVEKRDPDRGPLREPYRTTVGEQSIKAEQAREPARQN